MPLRLALPLQYAQMQTSSWLNGVDTPALNELFYRSFASYTCIETQTMNTLCNILSQVF